MRCLKIILTMACVSALCFGFNASYADAKDSESHSQMIVTFYENVSWEEIKQYSEEWSPYGVSIIMELPMFNCLVLKTPSEIKASDLSDDPRVEKVEDDQAVKLQNSVKGQYASFIEPVPKPPSDHYPWGILKLYDQYYDPWSLTSVYEREDLPDPVEQALCQLKRRKIRIAIFDTGIQFFRKDLYKVVKGGIDLVNNNTTNKQKNRHKLSVPFDDNGHGTYVAGIVCAALDQKGKWGRNANIELYAVKILDESAMGELSNIIMGFQWAIDNEIDIVNMSIGYKEDSLAIRRAVRVAHEFGLTMVASTGNHSNWDDTIILAADGGAADGGAADGGAADGGAADGGAADGGAADGGAADGGAADGGAADGGAADGGAADGGAADGGAADGGNESLPTFSVMYPARYPEVIAVGATTSFGELAAYSNSGSEMDIMAPGSNIISADITNGKRFNGYGYCSGTSQAAAHVTAAAALMLSLDPSMAPEELKKILVETSIMTGTATAGEINLVAALEEIISEGRD
ncbi:MAG: S8 family serine peptidase [Desulfobacteraceae bacterium]